ncbi:MAG TPA: AsmA family protein [Paucimonas sp.]|nr:AsmA family protein [Paucimonas sp.]HJW57493.1 AsmA family protein [Burkholderiaceae bacterium]
MPKPARYFLIAIGVALGLVLIAAGIIATTFNPNDYKPLIIRLVQEKKQRTLTIPGEIKLRFFPKIGADLGKVSISEHGSNAEFAAVDSAKVSLALIPLLSRQLVVDRVRIEGLRASIRYDKDGRSNVDDLLSKQESGGQQIRFDIDSVHLGNAHLMVDDRQAGRKIDIARLDLDTGRIANGVPSTLRLSADVKINQPDVNARVTMKSGFTLDLDRKHYVFKDLDAELAGGLAGFANLVLTLAGDADLAPEAKRFVLGGIRLSARGKRASQAIEAQFAIPMLAITDARVAGSKLAGDAKLTEGARSVSARFSAPSFEGSPQAFTLPAIALDAAILEGKLDAKATLSGALNGNIDKLLFTSPRLALALSGKHGNTALNGSLVTPLSINLKTQLIELSALAADVTLPNPGGGTLALKAGGNASVNLGKQNASATLKGRLGQSGFDARLGLSDFSPLAYTFDVGIDQLDLDRYKSKGAAQPEGKAAEQPMDFSALKNLRANGSVRVGALKVANIKSANVRFNVRAGGGKLDLNPLAANLYGGSVAGMLSLTADQPPHFAVRQSLTGIQVGPLLQDALGKTQLEGRGNVQLDVTASGATFERLKKNLNGTARIALRDGAVRGINIAQAVRNAKAQLDALRGQQQAQAGTASASEKTDFSELDGSFRIAGGVARNDDLAAKSPLIRLAGAGDVNLGEARLDYLVKATVVSTLQGQGGPELQALKGVTVPVRLTGPFGAIGWRIDFAGMASELAKQKVDEKKAEVKAQAQKKLEEEKAKLQEQLKGKLKGLFGN